MAERRSAMGGSGGSSSSSSISDLVECKCKKPAILFTSHTSQNPGKRFWRCPHWNESLSCKFFQWIPNSEDGNNVSPEGSDLLRYIGENEELKLKVASLLEEAQANAEEIVDLRKKIAKEEQDCRGLHDQVVKLKIKIGKKEKKVAAERNRVKVLGFVVVVLCVFITVLSIVIAMNVGGGTRQ